MKILAALTLAAGLVAGAASAEPILGTWKTQPDDGFYAHIKVLPCGSNFCGIIHRSFGPNGEFKSENNGKQLMRSMAPQGGGKYEGRVWRPSNNKVYLGKAEVSGNKMQLRGCVAGGLFCAKQTWTRIN